MNHREIVAAIHSAPFGENFDIDGVPHRKVMIRADKLPTGRCSTWPCPAWEPKERCDIPEKSPHYACEYGMPDAPAHAAPAVMRVDAIPRAAMKGWLA